MLVPTSSSSRMGHAAEHNQNQLRTPDSNHARGRWAPSATAVNMMVSPLRADGHSKADAMNKAADAEALGEQVRINMCPMISNEVITVAAKIIMFAFAAKPAPVADQAVGLATDEAVRAGLDADNVRDVLLDAAGHLAVNALV